MGEVWAALLAGGETMVAIRFMPPEICDDDDFQAGFVQEARAMARLSHEGLVRLIDMQPATLTPEGKPDPASTPHFLVMEIGHGETLADRRERRLDEVLYIFDAILEVLASMHARHIVHGDLRADNVHLQEHGFPVKLMDYGVSSQGETLAARLKASPLSRQGGLSIESARTMSPEQARGDHAAMGPASDLYALGVVLYEVLTGEPPFDDSFWGLVRRHQHDAAPRLSLPSSVPAEVAEPLRDLVAALLSKNYADRPESAADVRHQLSWIREKLPIEPIALPSPASAPPQHSASNTPKRRHPSLSEWSEELVETLHATSPPFPVEHIAATQESLASAMHHQSDTVRAQRELPLLGRVKEAARLRGMLDRVSTGGDPEGIVLVGDQGLGKRRVARWLVEKTLELGLARVIEVPLDTSVDLVEAMRLALYRRLRLPALTPDAVAARLDTDLGLDASHPDTAHLIHFLCALPTGAPPQTDPLSQAARFWRTALKAIATHPTPRPMLVWFDGGDDAHWNETVRWMRELLQEAQHSCLPMCFIWSPQSDGDPSDAFKVAWQGERIQKIRLGALEEDAMGELARHLAPSMDEASRSFLTTHSRGNPKLLRETLRFWDQLGLLTPGDDGVVKVSALTTPVLSDLHDAARRRLSTFLGAQPDPLKVERALKTLSILGPTFSRNAAAWALEGTPLTPEALLNAGLLIHRPLAQEPQLLFADATLLNLIVLNAQERGEVPGLLPDAIELLRRVALDAIIDRDWDSARRSITQALQLLREVTSLPSHDALLLDTLHMLGHLAVNLSDAATAQAIAQTCRQMMTRLDPISRPRAQAMIFFMEGHAAMLRQATGDAEEHFGRLDDAGPPPDLSLAALATAARAALALRQGRLDDAETLSQRARSALKAAADATRSPALKRLLTLASADATRRLAGLYDHKGNPALATRLLNRAMRIFQTEVAPHGELEGYIQITSALRKRLESQEQHDPEDIVRVRRYWKRLSGLMSALHQRGDTARVVWEGACISEIEGNLPMARAQYLEAARHFQVNDQLLGQARCQQRIGRVCAKNHEPRQALKHYRQFRDLAQKAQHVHLEAAALLDIAWLHKDLGEHSHADHAFTTISALSPAAPPALIAAALIGRASVAAHQDALTQTTEHLKAASKLVPEPPIQDARAHAALDLIYETLRDSPSLLARAARSLAKGLM